MPITKRKSLPKRVRDLSKIKETLQRIRRKQGEKLLAHRHYLATLETDAIPILDLLRATRGAFGSGYHPLAIAQMPLHESYSGRNRRVVDESSAIVTYCKSCGGGYGDHKLCDHMDCPLWAFRLGDNPLSR